MRNYIKEFSATYNYSEDVLSDMLSTYDVLENNTDFVELLNTFFKNTALTHPEVESILEKISKDSGVHIYIARFCFLICLSRELKDEYAERGLPEKIYHDSMDDLRCKLEECIACKGINGTFVSFEWFIQFYRFKLYALGRMEYALHTHHGNEFTVDGVKIADGTKTITVHIPSSGKPFTKEARAESYKKAAEFFKDEFPDGNVIFHCHSWLLYGVNKKILPETSNIVSFMGDFTLVEDNTTPWEEDGWRIFADAAENGPVNLPKDNTLKKAYAEHLEAGGSMGAGLGFFVYKI